MAGGGVFRAYTGLPRHGYGRFRRYTGWYRDLDLWNDLYAAILEAKKFIYITGVLLVLPNVALALLR